jgi:hypothetical protein
MLRKQDINNTTATASIIIIKGMSAYDILRLYFFGVSYHKFVLINVNKKKYGGSSIFFVKEIYLNLSTLP